MSCRMKFIVAVFVVLNCSITIKSDHIEDDCEEVQCPLPPEFECPTDSELKSSASHNLDDVDEYSDSNPFDLLAANGKIEELYPSSMLPSTTHSPRLLEKRSLQHRRREAIKIVPGDYRSFEPEFFKYHNHHQPHRKWKRDLVMVGVQPHTEAEIKKCCPEFQCVCRTCPNPPKCERDQVAIVVEEEHGLPGKCCPKYECVPEMECSIVSQPKASYWKSECLKCDCFGGHELCQRLCEVNEDQSAMNCFSGYLNRPKLNGDTWLEDEDCKECKCVNGDNQCLESYCKPVDCDNPIKVEGKCCRVCPEIPTTSTTSRPPTTMSPHEDEDFDSSTNIPSTQEVPVTTTTSSSTQPPSTETSSSTSTTSIPVTQVTTTSLEVDKSSTATPTLPSTTTDVKTKPQEIGNLLQEIDLIIVLIVVSAIFVIFTIAIGLFVSQRQKKKKLIYSTIPSSESSQSSSITLA